MLVSVRWLRHDTLCRGYNFFLIVFLFRLFSTWSGLCVNSSCRCIFLSIHENDSIASLYGNWVRKKFSTSICQSITSTSIHVADRKGMECCQVIDRASIYEWQHSRASHESLRNTQLPLRGKGKKPSSLSYRVLRSATHYWLTCSFAQECQQCRTGRTEHIWWWRQRKNRRVFPLKHRAFSRLQS